MHGCEQSSSQPLYHYFNALRASARGWGTARQTLFDSIKFNIKGENITKAKIKIRRFRVPFACDIEFTVLKFNN